MGPIRPMDGKAFTDEQLRRLKSGMVLNGKETKALIRRMEAAEAVIRHMEPPLRMMKTPAYEAWRKAAGK